MAISILLSTFHFLSQNPKSLYQLPCRIEEEIPTIALEDDHFIGDFLLAYELKYYFSTLTKQQLKRVVGR